MAPFGARNEITNVGGAGWTPGQARWACVGEALERCQAQPLPRDASLLACHDAWPIDEPAASPDVWVLFHPSQYALSDFPFRPFTGRTVCRWVCFRVAPTGEPVWVPEQLAFLYPREGDEHFIAPATSTGLTCGRVTDPVLIRGVQEVIERDGVMGAWWGSYPVEEWDESDVWAVLGPHVRVRLWRPNLTYRFYRVDSPFSGHLVLATLTGEDHAGVCFSTGAACRETRREAWLKAALEAVQGRHFVRRLRQAREPEQGFPRDFEAHATFYTLRPELLDATVLARALAPRPQDELLESREGLGALRERLGKAHPIWFRNVTPPWLAHANREWVVWKVLVPGLQPEHGNHALPQLGGPLWAPRTFLEWKTMLPHPFG